MIASAGRTTMQKALRACGCAAFIIAATVMASAAAEDEGIARIENSLLTTVVIRGHPTPMKLSERMEFYGVPGVSIAVINGGQIAWAKGYGVLIAGGLEPVTTDTRFQAASISKPVTAMAALALVEQGALTFDDDVNLRLRSWRVPDNVFTAREKVTLRRLLNHSAGLSRDEVGSYAADEALPTLTQALSGEGPAKLPAIRVESTPGSAWRYSGGGYSVVQQLMTDVTGKRFADLLQQLVFDKLQMSASAFSQPLRADWIGIAATGHDERGQPLAGGWHTFPEMAAAGLWTTPSDLGRFAIEVRRAVNGGTGRVLSQEMAKAMLTRGLGDYGLGFFLGGNGKVTTFSHGGSNEGFTCVVTANVETGQGAVIMTNGDRGSDLFNEILRAIAHEYGWSDYRPVEKRIVPADPIVYRAYVGEYEAAGGPPATISAQGDALYVLTSALAPTPLRLYPSAKDRFIVLERDIEFAFTRDGAGRVDGMDAEAAGRHIPARKTK